MRNKNKKTKYIISAREYSYIKEKWNLCSKNNPNLMGLGIRLEVKKEMKKYLKNTYRKVEEIKHLVFAVR